MPSTLYVSNFGDGSLSIANVQAAIDAAAAGDTVVMHAGSATWGAGATYLLVNKAITLQGQGDDTHITLTTDGPTYTSATIRLSNAPTVRDFKVTNVGSATTAFSTTGTNGWRITGINYSETGSSPFGYFVYVGNNYGLIDDCDVAGGGGTNELIFVRGPTDAWQTAVDYGSANAVYIENNRFTGSGYVCDANSNSRVVVRRNTIAGAMKVDGHGVASNSPARGVRMMEVYDNTWTGSGGFPTYVELRGGTGRAFNNVATLSTTGTFLLREYGCVSTWSNFDNKYQTPADYPILDQIGVGIDPKTAASEPYYLWLNRRGGSQWPISYGAAIPDGAKTQYAIDLGDPDGDPPVSFTMADVIAPDRDFFNESATFDGSSGVGIGTKAQMEAITPSLTGVGFWVTDEGTWDTTAEGTSGQLYIWDGAAWGLDYTPYTYPHPRVGSAPTAPSDLTATATGSSTIDLAWTDASSDETGFKIERSLNGSTGWTQIGTAAADATSYSDTGLSSGTAYYYRVRAYNTYGNSAYSASANDTTDAAPTVGAGRYVGSGAAAMF